MKNELGNLLKEARQLKGMTMLEVAKLLKLKSAQSVWDWENGKGSGVPVNALKILIKTYGLKRGHTLNLYVNFHTEKARAKALKRVKGMR
jgi:transcriptional regulator with XRE-family HTH domain